VVVEEQTAKRVMEMSESYKRENPMAKLEINDMNLFLLVSQGYYIKSLEPLPVSPDQSIALEIEYFLLKSWRTLAYTSIADANIALIDKKKAKVGMNLEGLENLEKQIVVQDWLLAVQKTVRNRIQEAEKEKQEAGPLDST
jgi:hypothetical protein